MALGVNCWLTTHILSLPLNLLAHVRQASQRAATPRKYTTYEVPLCQECMSTQREVQQRFWHLHGVVYEPLVYFIRMRPANCKLTWCRALPDNGTSTSSCPQQ